MKRYLSFVLCIALFLGCLPVNAIAANPPMNESVPVWTEETVREYALDYIAANDMSRLWEYYDLQIKRYVPQAAFEAFLIDLEFLTGDFIALGSYRSFADEESQTKTHVLHLCMEKIDVDMYFTHKDKPDDWEVMALEFALSAEEEILETAEVIDNQYTETAVTVGTAEYPLEGILTMPVKATSNTPVPACVFIHDFGAYNYDHAIGNTAMFADLAHELGEMGIASVRYDKRAYAYPDYTAETVWDEIVEDALSAVELLKNQNKVDQQRIVVIGVGLGGMVAPRIAYQSEGAVTAMIMIGSKSESLLDAEFARAGEYLASLSDEERSNQKYMVRSFGNYSEAKVRELTLLGRNGWYYREAEQYTQIRTIKKLELPTYIVQGREDPIVSEDDGRRVYQKDLGSYRYVKMEVFRGLNHLLMNDLTTDANGIPQYQVEAKVDKQAARTLAHWINGLYAEAE